MTFCGDSRSPEETRRLGAAIGKSAEAGDVIALEGPLGVGKTCLVQGIARGLEVDARTPVTSPSFTLVGEYEGRVPLRHADFYRVESYRRLEDAGFDDLLDGRGVVVVEWPERFPQALPSGPLLIELEFVGESSRRIRLSASGGRAKQLLEHAAKQWP
ncbi:MAG: tRNA (adenosine(37)-N6)-threonylcarbamoyltransferase complex ATPase subunit type 1 TsaE [Myxococcota bacterium]|nr:tRNA (adenosine(37)-N6)-threonylcarbamoyltransferase complex ATPase subunit type 1 TsaE [Myxococcota bacterium]